jgi:small conductance mechanosensitive channel
VPLFVAIVIVFDHREKWLGISTGGAHKHAASEWNVVSQALAAIALLILGLAIARDVGRSLGPPLFRRLDPATAGTVGFLIRLVTALVAVMVALGVAGVHARTLLVGGAFTAVVLGLAAQQTLGNVIAGTVLLSARPFQVGDRVRLQGGVLAGQVEGVVSSLGLLYTTFATGEDSVMVPNSVVLGVAVRPVREPDAVTMRARLRAGMTPGDLQEVLEHSLQTPLRGAPRITLEELDGLEAVVMITAVPRQAAQGRQLASELLEIVSRETREAQAQGSRGEGSASEGDGGSGSEGDGGSGSEGDGGSQARTGKQASSAGSSVTTGRELPAEPSA